MNPLRLFLAVALAATSPAFATGLDDELFGGRAGALVVIDTTSGKAQRVNAALCATPLPPCSTFKIFNTLIGLETGHLTTADAPMWKWDGVKRSIPAWNQDVTLRLAFQVSCVPAYQDLARRIGMPAMRKWIDRIGYGNRDLSAGVDVFWLPATGRKPLLISANEQAELMCRLVRGKLPFSKRSLAVLEDIMTAKETDLGMMYGKTGSGEADGTHPDLGWYVGYVVCGDRTVAFACVLTSPKAMGKDARAIVETALAREKLL